MARQKPFPEPEEDVPAWVMTFSDVITLLMTFFILLLTFATNTPATFDRMQVTVFGGGGSTGFVGEIDGMEKDAILNRMRARTGRQALDGTEVPPIHSDPALTSMADSIAGLEEQEDRVLATEHRLVQPINTIISGAGELTAVGLQQLKMLAVQMRKQPLRVDMVVSGEGDMDRAVALAMHLAHTEQIPIDKTGASIAQRQVPHGKIMFVVSREGANRGT